MYRYETHMHTCQASACGHSTGAEHARYYKSLGYQGIIVTDHFFGGNTAAPRTGNWADRVHAFASGFEDAWNEGQKIGLDVFFGWEQGYQGDEYLIYGPDVQWLVEHPEIEHCSRHEQLALVHAAGGCVVQAHPFRFRSYLSRILVAPDCCDGVEVANMGNDQLSDYYAAIYAKQYGKTAMAGSDNHDSKPDCPLMGIELVKPLNNLCELADLVRGHGSIALTGDGSRFLRPESILLPMKCYELDAQEQPVRYAQPWLED